MYICLLFLEQREVGVRDLHVILELLYLTTNQRVIQHYKRNFSRLNHIVNSLIYLYTKAEFECQNIFEKLFDTIFK